MSYSLVILFWLRRNRVKNGKAPLNVRITYNTRRVEMPTGRDITVEIWDPKSQRATGKNQEARDINSFLALLQSKIESAAQKLMLRDEEITAESIRNEFQGVKPEKKTFMQVFDFKLKTVGEEVKVGKKAQGTLTRYEILQAHLIAFLKANYQVSDLVVDLIDYNFMSDFEFYLSVKKGLGNNTAMKYVSMAKSIALLAFKRGWASNNRAATFSCSFNYGEPVRLEMHELMQIYETEFSLPRLEMARDVFVFMCFTGFGYIDTFSLTKSDIFWGIDRTKWISKNRQKTDGVEAVPLLDIPLKIIEKYEANPSCINTGKLFPVYSNQKFNEYLKEIATFCGINKPLKTHSGRHTFATAITLENDVPIETVSKMLGHKSIKTTQRYAHVTRKKISNNMNELRNKLQDLGTKESVLYKTS